MSTEVATPVTAAPAPVSDKLTKKQLTAEQTKWKRMTAAIGTLMEDTA